MSILLVNDHLSGGIGRYVRGLYSELRTLYAARHSVHLLLQNVPRHADATAWSDGNANDITMQRRPWWEKQSGYGTLYQLASRYYYPQRIPRGYALYHVTSQMMGQSVRHVGPAVVTVHDLVALRYPGNHPWISTQIRKRHVAARVPEVVLLVRVGGRSHRASRLITRLKLERHVRYEHDVSDATLALWYAAADALVFPSLLEGFGLPLLEALRCGCPVIAANTSSIPEVTGDAAALVDDPLDPGELAAAIVRVLEDSEWRDQLRQRALSRAAGFSWRLAAERTAAVYERVLGMSAS